MSPAIVDELSKLAARAVELAIDHGADAVEAVAVDSEELAATVRMGDPEQVVNARTRAITMRIFKGNRRVFVGTSDMHARRLAAFIAESVRSATLVEPDELNQLVSRDELAAEACELDLYDAESEAMDGAEALRRAAEGEAAARAADPRITNSRGATWSRALSALALADSSGFAIGYRGSRSQLTVEVLCDDTGGKKRSGAAFTANRFQCELADPAAVGVEAARRAVAQLGSRKIESCAVPIVFDPEAGSGILNLVFLVANGATFARRATYLVEREGTPIASELVTIEDDPLLRRATGSRPFDGDGLPTRKNVVVDRGVLTTILCDVYHGRALGRRSTGSAAHGAGASSSPGITNFLMRPGASSRDQIIAATDRGLLVTRTLGFGFNALTGDLSRGAEGFWIEGGRVLFPVSEVTIAANLDELLRRIDMVGDDLDTRAALMCPTFRVSLMTVGGK